MARSGASARINAYEDFLFAPVDELVIERVAVILVAADEILQLVESEASRRMSTVVLQEDVELCYAIADNLLRRLTM